MHDKGDGEIYLERKRLELNVSKSKVMRFSQKREEEDGEMVVERKRVRRS